MTELCGSDGPWTRVAHLNMSNPNEECPEGFRKCNDRGITFCGRPVSSQGGCKQLYSWTTACDTIQITMVYIHASLALIIGHK